MCLATPLKIIKINGSKAETEAEGHIHEIDLSLLENAKTKEGDYVIAHENMAIHKLSAEEAKQILSFINNEKDSGCGNSCSCCSGCH